ncbi:MAG: glutaminyl-peptide cyclotransferase [Thermodesulfobacteriota bacterium]
MIRKNISLLLLIVLVFVLLPVSHTLPSHTSDARADEDASVPVFGYEVINTYPHDRNAFTQGLLIYDGTLYEGTGLRGRSSLRKVDLKTGKVLKEHDIPNAYFGEGVAVDGNRIVQLTWQSHKGFVYDRNTFTLIKTFNYPTEGWGITFDGRNFIMSDGSATLYFLDPESFAEVGRLEVYDDKGPVTELNELEYVKGEIYANIWGSNRIARIDPATGRITGWIDLSGLLSEDDRKIPVDVLNGIAYDNDTGRLFVTGKLWPKIFEIKIVPKEK